jgi:hypothetical protein
MDSEAVAWKIVRRVRERFVGLKRQPTDDDWAEEIASVLSKNAGVDARSIINRRNRGKRQKSSHAPTVQP